MCEENVSRSLYVEIARLDSLRDNDTRHYKELRHAESGRIDALRAVDVNAVQQASAIAITQANTLANQVATSSETLRNQVTATAVAAQAALTTALTAIQKDIADLRQAQYQAQGQKAQTAETQVASADSRGNTNIVLTIVAIVGPILTIVVVKLLGL